MDKLTEAIKNLIPGDQVNEVAEVVRGLVAEAEEQIRADYSAKLDEAYKKLDEEVEAAEAIANNGYQQAYEIIQDLWSRLESQKTEFETAIEEGFNQAYAAIQEEKNKNNNVEVELYDEFNGKLKEMRDFMIDKLDVFIEEELGTAYQEAVRQISNDPLQVEHKVAVEKMADILSQYMSHGNYSHVTNRKIDEAVEHVKELQGQIRLLESRNVRLHGQNVKLNEQVREATGLLTEAARTERKERANKPKNASGRGQRVAEESIISEFHNPAASKQDVVTESHDELDDLLHLSGIYEQEEKMAKFKAEKKQQLNG